MVSDFIINKFKDKNCEICEGEGTVCSWDGDSEYCLCVKENRAERQGEMLMETANEN